ncbi:MAG: 3-oxoacyl-ACP reductase FabG [Pseudomonadales bacterium]
MSRVAIVTGASRGIGKAIAEALVEAGHFVVGTATSEAGAAGISDNLANGRGEVLDVSDEASIEAFFANISDLDAATVLVNNAGITKDNIALRMKGDEWQDVINTNLNSVYHVAKGCLRGMTKARWGRIINISSVVGSMGNPGQSNYAAAKAGMEGYSRALAAELGSRNITVNAIAPGFIQTDMTDDLAEDQQAALLTRVPLGRLGEASEVAALVSFLASDAAGYITGETIHINGGMYMA